MKKYVIFNMLIVFLFVFVFSQIVDAFSDNTKVTIIVVSEDGKPLDGVDAGVGFEKNADWSTKTSAKRGLTDENGKFVAYGNCDGHIGYGARKEGYYSSNYEYNFQDSDDSGSYKWSSEFKIVLRKIENPVPMYVRDTTMSKKRMTIPVVGKEVGFDLIVYDWVVPYGVGQHVDIICNLTKKFTSRNDYEGKFIITFLNPYDGILLVEENLRYGSQFKLPRYAPETGYQRELIIYTSKNPSGKWISGYRETDNYLFRVRSEVKDGKLVKAMYGKIRGPIQIDPRVEPAKIFFAYYLNPDYTRNLEFDPKRNLFGNLSDLERVTEP